MKKKHKDKRLDAIVLAKIFKEGSAEEIIKQYDQFKVKAIRDSGLYDELRLILNNPIQHDEQEKKVHEILCEWHDLCRTTISQKTSFKAYSKNELYKMRECMIIAMVEIKDLFCEVDSSAKKGIQILTVMQDMAWAYCKKEAREKMMDYLEDIVQWVGDNDEECEKYYQKKSEIAVKENIKQLEKIMSENPTKTHSSKSLIWPISAGMCMLVVISVLLILCLSGLKELEQISKDRLHDVNDALYEENQKLVETNRELTERIKELESLIDISEAEDEIETENGPETDEEIDIESDAEPGRPFQLVDSRIIRNGKGKNYEKLATVKAGETVYVLEEAKIDGWMKVQYQEIIGYMNPFEGADNI